MDYFGPKDMLQMIGQNEGISPGPDQRQQAFLDAFAKAKQAEAAGGQMAPMQQGVATAGPSMAAPSPAVQTVANAMQQPMFAQQPMQQQRPMMGQFAGVALPRFG